MNISYKELKNEQRNAQRYISAAALLKKIKIYLECLRIKEVILIGGVTFIGLVSNTNHFDLNVFFSWIIAMLSSYSLLGYAFLSNDWSGYNYDKNDPNKKNKPLIKGEISLTEVKILCIGLLIVSLTLAASLSYLTLIMAASIAVLNYLYSGNKIFLKSVPVASSLIHGIGAALGFLLGFTFQGNISLSGILFGIYFGLIYAGGHLNHEISDIESDEKSSITTNANRFGKRKTFAASFIIFSLSFFYILFLSINKILPAELIIGVLIAYPFYALFFFKTLQTSLNYNAMISFRRKYRIIFLLWGIFMAFVIISNYNFFK